MKITKTEHQHKLAQASHLIDDAYHAHDVDAKVLATWLRVAGDYCHQVAEELLDETIKSD